MVKNSFSKKRLNDSCKLSRRYAANCPCNGRLSVHPSVCMSSRPTAAATSRWFAAELGRGQQISIDSCRRRAPPDDRSLQAPEVRLRSSSCREPRYEAQHGVVLNVACLKGGDTQNADTGRWIKSYFSSPGWRRQSEC